MNRLSRLFKYHETVDECWRASAASGGILGAGYWIGSESRKESQTLLGNVAGAGFCTGLGVLGGLGTISLYPLVLAGLAVGGPTYLFQQFRSKTICP